MSLRRLLARLVPGRIAAEPRIYGAGSHPVRRSQISRGAQDVVRKLQQAGLGDQVKSWIGTGQNLPITADQIKQVLGSDVVRQLAAKYNIPIDQVAEVLAHQLPVAVDRASPDGKLPHSA